ncbi:MAG: glucose-6-phosphate dehydrogenase [Caulobacterales bacterium]
MPDCAFVLFGATGDLAERMLWPSLYFLEEDGLLPDGIVFIGNSRTMLEDAAFHTFVKEAVRQRAKGKIDHDIWDRFARRLRFCAGSVTDKATFAQLASLCGEAPDKIFYLSTSPALYAGIVEGLAGAGLSGPPSRIIIEKPLGRDLASCTEINDALSAVFSEDRIFRIDHYLGKETVQNLIALRFANTLFEPLWNAVSIDHVQISVSETVGVEGRGAYYDEYGALRDMVQSHLLQLLALIAMEPPSSLDPDAVRNEKVKVLRSLRQIEAKEIGKFAVRGQYRKGFADGQEAPDYASEVGLAASDTETYAAVCAHIDNWRWAGVPFYLRTGKRMPERSSQIVIQFRDVPHSIFAGSQLDANRLTIRLQPEEGISLSLMNKRPTLEEAGFNLQPVSLNLSLSDEDSNGRRRIAYERLLLEAIHSNSTLFVRRDEAEAAWRWIDQIQSGWAQSKSAPLPYNAGTWGPSASFGLLERDGRSWCE